MKPLALILAFAAVSAAQKPLKSKKPAYIAHSPGGGSEHAGAYQAASPQSSVSNHGGFGGGHHGGGGSFSSGIGKGASKTTYPLLLSDTRTLNPDGTINFDYKADNGLHQGESVDSDGTRRGFYSYPGADGKLITVKYTAGKNGFVAEGPHLPKQPQSAPYNPKHDDIYSSGKQGSFGGGHGGGGHYSQQAPAHHGGASQGAYRPGAGLGGQGHNQATHYSHSTLGGAGSQGGQGGGASFANFPDFSSQFPSSSSGHGGSPSYSSGGNSGRYSGAGAGLGGGQQVSGHPGGSSSFSSLGGLGGQGGANFADFGSSNLGAQYSGPMFTANNPYQPTLAAANPANPVNAGFDLGNGGHFSINFAPGVAQEYPVNANDISGNYGGQGGHGGGAGSYSGGSGHGSESQGRY